MKAELRAILLSDVAVLALVGQRIYPHWLPQSPTYPAITLYRSSVERENRTFCNGAAQTTNKVRSTFQVDCWDKSATGSPTESGPKRVERLAQSVRGALMDYQGTVGSVRIDDIAIVSDSDLVDPEPGIYRVSLSINIWHTE